MGGTGSEQRDFLHVQDASSYLAAAARDASTACPIFNAGTGQAVSVREMAEELLRVWGGNAQASFTGKCRAGDPHFLVADLAHLPSTVSVQFRPWRHGLLEYVNWFHSDRKNMQ